MNQFNQINEYIKSLFPEKGFIPLHEPCFNGKEKEYLLDTIDSTFVSSIGPYVDSLENMVAKITSAKKAVAVVNGTAGLQVALRLVGVTSGDEVITQALSFVATANAISYNGATPLFIDVDLDTMGLSPKALDVFLDEFGELRDAGCYNKQTGSRISACVPVHTFGFPVHMDELLVVCKKWNIPIVEDAAESIGSIYKGVPTGALGTMGVFSFNGNKIVTCGGGGAIVSNDIHLAERGKYLTTTAKKPHPYEFYHDELGYNYRMPNLNAALACAQLEQLDGFIENKRKLANEYSLFFEKIGVKFRTELPNTKANYWLMCIELNDKNDREQFLKLTNDNKVMTRPIWQLMFKLPMFKHCRKDAQKNALFLEERIVNIPSSVMLRR